jgi:XTP/dITP diphosphohydrolase
MKESKIIVIATGNKGKVREFKELFDPLGIEVRSLVDFSDLPDIVEDGETFAANAWKKAATISAALKLPVFADDSGLCVDALGGAPGVYSARYAGEHATDSANIDKLLRTLADVGASADAAGGTAAADTQPRLLSTARFVCALALVDPAKAEPLFAEGTCEGYILAEPRGAGGFGYDPVFYLPEFGLSMAELSPEAKNGISHRGKALQSFLSKWQDW